MMNFKDLNLKRHYDSDEDDILNSFLIPVLSCSIRYKRLTGFFSSNSLSLAARGVIGLIMNNGKMELICSPKLEPEDVLEILKNYNKKNEIIESVMLNEINKIKELEDVIAYDHIRALGWMVKNNYLDIKVATIKYENFNTDDALCIKETGIFHQKVGIFEDMDGNRISFNGSNNETYSGWRGNIEEFKVFRSWIETEKDYLEYDYDKFTKFWKGRGNNIEILEVPFAVKKGLISIAPEDIKELNLNGECHKYKKNVCIKLRPHQEKAVRNWLNNSMRGIFEIATGGGKTFAALECVKEASKLHNKLVTIISTPFSHLSKQWEGEIQKYGIKYSIILADSSKSSWKHELNDLLNDVYIGYENYCVVVTTHASLASDDFIFIVNKHINSIPFLLIADEVHGLGSKIRANGLLDGYKMRLGLSATPTRWFDESGTKILLDYFEGVIYEYTLRDGINDGYLVPYYYFPLFTTLNEEELYQYVDVTKKIVKLINQYDDINNDHSSLKTLLFKRSNIIKNAENKYKIYKNLLNDLIKREDELKWIITYCSPEQIDIVMELNKEQNIRAHRFTMEEDSRPIYGGLSERDIILNNFADGKISMLVAMKCLDEGINIPEARKAILMCSSGNPREYIQRIGRVIRKHENKKYAEIYDIIIVPTYENIPYELIEYEKKIFMKEVERYKEIAINAENNLESMNSINRLLESSINKNINIDYERP